MICTHTPILPDQEISTMYLPNFKYPYPNVLWKDTVKSWFDFSMPRFYGELNVSTQDVTLSDGTIIATERQIRFKFDVWVAEVGIDVMDYKAEILKFFVEYFSTIRYTPLRDNKYYFLQFSFIEPVNINSAKITVKSGFSTSGVPYIELNITDIISKY